MTTPFQLLNSGQLQNIQLIPSILNKNNVNDTNNTLNIFEALCDIMPRQADPNIKNVLEIITTQIFEKMISIPETKWNKKDMNGNTILEWGVWSGSSKVMDIFYKNEKILNQFIAVERTQIQNFTRVINSQHLSDIFKNQQIEKFKEIGLEVLNFNQASPFELLNSKLLVGIKHIPVILDETNVNDTNNTLNIFEALCNIVSNEADQNIKNVLEVTIVQILEKMVSILNTDWNKKDIDYNTILEWGIWSGSSKVMDVFHNHQKLTNRLIAVEKAQNHNFWRVMAEPHIPDDFRNEQAEKFKAAGLSINAFGQDSHTSLFNVINIYLRKYLDKYEHINYNPNDQNIISFQNQIDKCHKIVQNLLKIGANPSLEADNILVLMVQGSLQIQKIISEISDKGHKFLAGKNFKLLVDNIKYLVEKTLENYDLSNSNIGNNIIAEFGGKIFSINQSILKTQDQKQKTLLIESFRELKTLAEPIIEQISKQPGFNPDIKDQSGFSAVAWLSEFGADFLHKCIDNMKTKPNMNQHDNKGMSVLHWYSDYNVAKIVEVLVKKGSNVNDQNDKNAATPVHFLFLNETKVNADNPKLSTLKVLLNKENEPPFNPNIRMVGNKTAADILEEKKASISDYDSCNKELQEYTEWYNVEALGQQVEELDLYA